MRPSRAVFQARLRVVVLFVGMMSTKQRVAQFWDTIHAFTLCVLLSNRRVPDIPSVTAEMELLSGLRWVKYNMWWKVFVVISKWTCHKKNKKTRLVIDEGDQTSCFPRTPPVFTSCFQFLFVLFLCCSTQGGKIMRRNSFYPYRGGRL